MPLLYLAIVFLVIVLALVVRRPLAQAISLGLVTAVLLFRIPPAQIAALVGKVFTDWSSFSVLVSLYLITFLQRMLEKRQQIKLAQQDLNGLFHNRRVNAGIAPLFIGLLPSAAAMLLCADIVKDSTDGYLEPPEQAFVTSWFRHIPESCLPTYASILLLTNLSNTNLPSFMALMVLPMLVLAGLGYFRYLRRLPMDPGTPVSQDKKKDAIHLFQHLWSLLFIILTIMVFKLSVVTAILLSMLLCVVVYRFKGDELRPMVTSAFEKKLIGNTFLVLVLKNFLAYTGVLEQLPKAMAHLPIPTFLVFVILFLVGGIISGSSGIIALGTPIAMATLGHEGLPIVVLLACVTHAASQLSPTHVCLVVASEYFHIPLGALIRKTIPNSVLFITFAICYYLFLKTVLL